MNIKDINLTKSQETKLIHLFESRDFYNTFTNISDHQTTKDTIDNFTKNNKVLTAQYLYNTTGNRVFYRWLKDLEPNTDPKKKNVMNTFLIKLLIYTANEKINILYLYKILLFEICKFLFGSRINDELIVSDLKELYGDFVISIQYLFRKVDTPKNNQNFLSEFYALFYGEPINTSYNGAIQLIPYRIKGVKLILEELFKNTNIKLKLDKTSIDNITPNLINHLNIIKDVFKNNKKLAKFKQEKDSLSLLKDLEAEHSNLCFYIPSLMTAIVESSIINIIINSNDKQTIKKCYEDFSTVIKTGIVKIENKEKISLFLSNLVNLLKYDNKSDIINHIYLIKILGLDNKKATSLINKLEAVTKIDNKFLNNNPNMFNAFNDFSSNNTIIYDFTF